MLEFLFPLYIMFTRSLMSFIDFNCNTLANNVRRRASRLRNFFNQIEVNPPVQMNILRSAYAIKFPLLRTTRSEQEKARRTDLPA